MPNPHMETYINDKPIKEIKGECDENVGAKLEILPILRLVLI